MTTSRQTLALALATALVLVLAGCGGAAPAGTSVVVTASAVPDPGPEEAVEEFFAAFDEIVLTGDTTPWTERSAPGCTYCEAVARYAATFGLGAGVRGARTLEEVGLAGYDVVVLGSTDHGDGTAEVDVRLELLLTDLLPVTPSMVGPDGEIDATSLSTAVAAGPEPARVALAAEGDGWTVTAITGVPADASADGTVAGTVRDDDVDGALAALSRYLEAERQVYLTGDTSAVAALAPRGCADCWTRIALGEQSYRAGYVLTGGRTTLELQRRVTSDEVLGAGTYDPADVVGVYYLDVTVRSEALTLRGGGTTSAQPATSYTLAATVVAAPGGGWEVWQVAELG